MNYRRNHLLLCLLLALTAHVTAQDHAVSGQVVFPDGYLPGGNVMVLDARDSSFIQGDYFMEGDFAVAGITAETVLLRFSSLEFADHYRAVSFRENATVHLGRVEVSNQGVALDAVVVRGRKRVFSQRADGSVEVVVANTTLAASNSSLEVLSRTPEVLLDETGAISVVGRGAAILYLNGQRITEEQLALVAPENIQKMVVIRNPSARYEASGGAVIEITTIRGRDDGYRLSLKQNVGNANFGGWQTYSGASLNANRGRLSVNANYALRRGDDRFVKITTRDRRDPAEFFSSDVALDWQNEYPGHHLYGLGLQYDAPGGGYLSLAYSGFREQTEGNNFNTNRIVDLGTELDYTSVIRMNETDRNNSLALNYGRELDSLGSRLFVGAQYARFDNTTDNPIEEEGLTPEGPTRRWLNSLLDLEVLIGSARVDYTKAFRGGNSLEVGLRYGDVTNDSQLDFSVSEDNETFRPETGLSSYYRYEERVGAAYLNFSGQLSENFSYGAGLRAEVTDYLLTLPGNDDQPIADNYFNLFPNASLSWKLPRERTLSLVYAARVQRPSFQSLNPNLIYQDPYTSVQGNPELVPEKSHALEMIAKLGKNTLRAGYTFTLDPLRGSAIRGAGPREYILKRLNFSESHQWQASVARTFVTDWWTSNNSLTLSYTQIYAFELEVEPVEPRIHPYVFTNNRFKVGNLGFLEANFYYVGERREGTFIRYDYSDLTLAAERSFLDDALTVRLIAADVFNNVRASGDYRVDATDIYFDNKWRSSYFRLALGFDFGKLSKARYKNEGAGNSERDRI